jgi:hypothetical protein
VDCLDSRKSGRDRLETRSRRGEALVQPPPELDLDRGMIGILGAILRFARIKHKVVQPLIGPREHQRRGRLVPILAQAAARADDQLVSGRANHRLFVFEVFAEDDVVRRCARPFLEQRQQVNSVQTGRRRRLHQVEDRRDDVDQFDEVGNAAIALEMTRPAHDERDSHRRLVEAVISDWRLVVHRGELQYARWKSTPCAASASRFGVARRGSPSMPSIPPR